MTRFRIMVSGANGQLGSELKSLASSYPEFDFCLLTRDQFDLRNPAGIEALISTYQPTHFINCAAYTAVDKAEAEPDVAFAVNANAIENIAKACASADVLLMHISTDYVFDGKSEIPYKEDDTTGPINVYGQSKLLGEQLCIKNAPSSIVIRTSWVYSSFGHNFVKTMLRLLREKDTINVVNDQVGSPTWAGDLARAILAIIASGKWSAGIYHYSGRGQISWYEFAAEIGRFIHSACVIHPIPSSDFPTPARRPAFSLLNTTKIESTFGVKVSPWKESLYHCLNQLVPSS